jgi:uncharacterized protein involved in exopolysaccharide biosynthesis
VKEISTPQNEIDLLAIAKKLFLSKTKILKYIFIFFLVGLLGSFLMEKTYTSSVEFISLSGNDASKSSIGGLASLAGISLGGDLLSSSDLSPIQYPEIISSSKFRKEILNTPISFEGQILTYKEIMLIRNKRLLPTIKKYTIGFPGQIMKQFISQPILNNNINDSSIILSSYEDVLMMNGLENVINIDVDAKDGSLTITCNFIDPLGTAQLTQKVFELLQKKVIELKLKQSQYTLNRTKAVLNEKEHLLYIAQNNLAAFKDKNNFINTSSFQNQLIRLQTENDHANAVYQQVAAQVEQAKLDITKNTPIFSVLQSVEVPIMKTAPKRFLIASIFGFLGFIIACSMVLFSDIFYDFLNKFKQ